MNRQHNATFAHADLVATAARFDRGPSHHVGATFHKPAPQRVVTVRRPGRIMRALYAFLIGANF